MRENVIALSRALFWSGLCAVTVLSLLPTTYFPPLAFNVWDKAQHALAYFALTLTGLTGWVGRSVLLVIGLLIHGAIIELVQSQLGWRRGDVLDWGADSVGVIVGWILVRVLRQRLA